MAAMHWAHNATEDMSLRENKIWKVMTLCIHQWHFFFVFLFLSSEEGDFFNFFYFLLSRDKTWRYLAKNIDVGRQWFNSESIKYPFTRGIHKIRSTHFCLYWDVLFFENKLLLKVLSNLKRFLFDTDNWIMFLSNAYFKFVLNKFGQMIKFQI